VETQAMTSCKEHYLNKTMSNSSSHHLCKQHTLISNPTSPHILYKTIHPDLRASRTWAYGIYQIDGKCSSLYHRAHRPHRI